MVILYVFCLMQSLKPALLIAAAEGIRAYTKGELQVRALQEYF